MKGKNEEIIIAHPLDKLLTTVRDHAFAVATLIATYTGADAGHNYHHYCHHRLLSLLLAIFLQENCSFSAATSASVAGTYSELL